MCLWVFVGKMMFLCWSKQNVLSIQYVPKCAKVCWFYICIYHFLIISGQYIIHQPLSQGNFGKVSLTFTTLKKWGRRFGGFQPRWSWRVTCHRNIRSKLRKTNTSMKTNTNKQNTQLHINYSFFLCFVLCFFLSFSLRFRAQKPLPCPVPNRTRPRDNACWTSAHDVCTKLQRITPKRHGRGQDIVIYIYIWHI